MVRQNGSSLESLARASQVSNNDLCSLSSSIFLSRSLSLDVSSCPLVDNVVGWFVGWVGWVDGSLFLSLSLSLSLSFSLFHFFFFLFFSLFSLPLISLLLISFHFFSTLPLLSCLPFHTLLLFLLILFHSFLSSLLISPYHHFIIVFSLHSSYSVPSKSFVSLFLVLLACNQKDSVICLFVENDYCRRLRIWMVNYSIFFHISIFRVFFLGFPCSLSLRFCSLNVLWCYILLSFIGRTLFCGSWKRM